MGTSTLNKISDPETHAFTVIAPSPAWEEDQPGSGRAGREQEGAHLVFRLGRREFAFPTSFLRDVRALPPVEKPQQTAAWWTGALHLPEGLVAVVDLRAKLGLPRKTSQRLSTLVVVELILTAKERRIGLVVDWVQDVRRLSPADLVPSQTPQPYIRGLVRGTPRPCSVLFLPNLFNIWEAAYLERTLEAVEAALRVSAE